MSLELEVQGIAIKNTIFMGDINVCQLYDYPTSVEQFYLTEILTSWWHCSKRHYDLSPRENITNYDISQYVRMRVLKTKS